MDKLLLDLRYGLRGILRNPSFAAVALLTLTLGIGATTAMFSVVNAVLLRKLPYRDPGRLVMIRELIPKIDSAPISVPSPDILDFRDRSQAFSGVAGYKQRNFELIAQGSPQRVAGVRISANTFSVLGVSPLLGRGFTAEEDRPGQRVVVLSYALWQREFAGDRGVLGRTVAINRIPHVVIGVMPRDFLYPIAAGADEPAQLWVPLALAPEEIAARGDNFDAGVVARIKPEVSFAQAQSDVERVAQYIKDQYPADVRGELDMRGVITPLSEVAFGDLRRPLLALFGGVLGRTVNINRLPYVVVGVMPRSFLYPIQQGNNEPAALWVPLALAPEEIAARGDNFDAGVVARLKPGVSFEQAQTDVQRVAQYIKDQYPADVRGELDMRGVITPLSDVAFGDLRRPLLALLGAVLFILLIAAANVANLLLTRATARQKEIAVRIALGATPARLVTQLLAESVTLSLAGGALGALFAAFATDFIVRLVPGNVPRLQQAEVNPQVLLFALGVSLAAGMVFGLAPVFLALRTRLNENLKEGGRGGSFGRQHRRLRSAFVVAEISLALVLLFAAGLLVRSFQKLMETNPGFAPDHVITASISLPPSQYAQPSQLRSFQNSLLERMQHIPGARTAGIASDLPLESSWVRIFTAEGYNPPPGAAMNVDSHTVVAGDYFRALGVPLLRGRFFQPSDGANSPKVLIVSDSLARKYWPNQDPVGKRLKWGPPQSDSPWLTVVGVVGDVKQQSLDKATLPHTYEPYSQLADELIVQGITRTYRLAVRTSGDPASAAASLKAAVWGLDRQLAVTRTRTMEQVLSESSAPRRFNMILVLLFAATALLLAAIGIYGVIAYSVQQRTHEIGIRMTLGARRADVLRMVLRWGFLLAGVGAAIGVAGALAAGRVLRGFLFGIQPSDPLTFVAVVGALALIALLATYIPARRATRVDPMVALRYE